MGGLQSKAVPLGTLATGVPVPVPWADAAQKEPPAGSGAFGGWAEGTPGMPGGVVKRHSPHLPWLGSRAPIPAHPPENTVACVPFLW